MRTCHPVAIPSSATAYQALDGGDTYSLSSGADPQTFAGRESASEPSALEARAAPSQPVHGPPGGSVAGRPSRRSLTGGGGQIFSVASAGRLLTPVAVACTPSQVAPCSVHADRPRLKDTAGGHDGERRDGVCLKGGTARRPSPASDASRGLASVWTAGGTYVLGEGVHAQGEVAQGDRCPPLRRP